MDTHFAPLKMHSKENIESQAFLEEFDRPTEKPEGSKRTLRSIATWSNLYLLFLHIFIVSLLWSMYSKRTAPTFRLPDNEATWSPAQHVIEYEINDEHTTNQSLYSKYSGPPSDEQDEAWDALMRPVYFNASLDEIHKAEETFRDDLSGIMGGGYLATLGVYHELHCLRQLRFWLFKDRYYPDLTEPEKAYQHAHLDHCIETLRLTIQCHANTALYTFYWGGPTDLRPLTQSNSRSVCAKWGPLEEWAYSRMVPTSPEFARKRLEN